MFSSCMSNFYTFQLSFLLADTMTPFKRYEHLLEFVKMYPCLYNKQEKDFKKEEVKQRAWKEIAKELDLENGKVVEQLWNNFKKLLSKRRKALEELNYLSWLFPFVKVRKTKSNLSLAKEGVIISV